MQFLCSDRLGEPQFIRVQRGAGDEGFVLRAVEPVAREGIAEVRHVDAQLMRAPCLRAQTQEREAVAYLQGLILCEARKTVRADAAANDGALRAANGRIDDAARRLDFADGDGTVLAPQIA